MAPAALPLTVALALAFGSSAWAASGMADPASSRGRAAAEASCPGPSACWSSLGIGGARLNYLVAPSPDASQGASPTAAIVGIHGHPRDVQKTLQAVRSAAMAGRAQASTLVVAPLFQVATADAGRCKGDGLPEPQPDDITWTCASWIDGAPSRPTASGARVQSFAALDALLLDLQRRWPSLKTITVAGFSAGAQFVQHYVGLAATDAGREPRATVRYVVASPGSWLYFDDRRENMDGAPAPRCPGDDDWKYGLEALPAWLDPDRVALAAGRYAKADVRYLVGALDDGPGRGAAFSILDKSCAANAQGATRLQRALAYAAHDRATLATAVPRYTAIVPGCAHDVACVFPSPAGVAALLAH